MGSVWKIDNVQNCLYNQHYLKKALLAKAYPVIHLGLNITSKKWTWVTKGKKQRSGRENVVFSQVLSLSCPLLSCCLWAHGASTLSCSIWAFWVLCFAHMGSILNQPLNVSYHGKKIDSSITICSINAVYSNRKYSWFADQCSQVQNSIAPYQCVRKSHSASWFWPQKKNRKKEKDHLV